MFHSEQAQRKRRLVGASLLCSAFLLLAFGLPPTESKPSPKDSGGKGKLLYIEGASDLFANFKARASRSKIHIESKMGGSIWDDKTPEKVLVYNNENKVYFLQDAKAYLTDLNQDFLPIPIEDLDAPTKVQFDGRPARRYLGYAKLGKMGKQCVADFTCLDGFVLTPSAHRMWCRFLGLNRGDFGLPVLLTQRRARVVGYDDKTVKLQHRISIADLPGISMTFGNAGITDYYTGTRRNRKGPDFTFNQVSSDTMDHLRK